MAGDTLSQAERELKKREEDVTAALAASTERMWAATQLLLERCALRSAMGDSQGALQDAKKALETTPEYPEYLIQTAQALIDASHGEQAFETFQRATAIVRGSEDHDEARDASLASLDRRLRPHNDLPDELLASIFEWVYLDWQHLPSPFQVAHVCSRWRRVALSTPALWRDTRILRVAVQLPCDEFLTIPIRKPFCLPPLSGCPDGRGKHPRGNKHHSLLDFCAAQSHDTIIHHELSTSSVGTEWEPFDEVCASAPHLQSLSVVNHDENNDLFHDTLQLIFQCPKLATLELSLGETQPYDDPELKSVSKLWSSEPSFRTLKLHNFNYFDGRGNLGARQVFLQRSTRLESLTILEAPGRDSSPAGSDFIQELLLQTADSLVSLETSARAKIFQRASQLGLASLPRLRRFRHVPLVKKEYYDDEAIAPDLALIDLPSIETLEAPFDVISTMVNIPPRICFQIYNTDDVDRIANWLRAFDGAERLQELRLEAVIGCGYPALLQHLIDVLTPSKEGKVICPQLRSFAYVARDAILRRGSESSPFDIDPVRKAKPIFANDWRWRIDASCVASMEAERRRSAAGLPPVALKRPFSGSKVASPRACGAEKATAAIDEASDVLPRCEPLKSVILEDCFVQPDVWAAMKASPTCQYEVYPDPDEMSRLAKWPHGPQHRLRFHYL